MSINKKYFLQISINKKIFTDKKQKLQYEVIQNDLHQ